jgi:calcium-dependent protein kinase
MVDKSKDTNNQGKDIKLTKSNFVNYKKGNIEADYELRETLGSGAFAKVVKVLHKKSGQYRALKIIKKQKDQDPARMYLEVEILKKLVHPNIMQIFEFYEDKKNFQIITELCEGGELFDMIVEKGSFNEDEGAWVMKQLLSAVNYIHTNSICHRDIKPENILLDTKKDNIIKIIDWGTARFFDKSKKMNKISGTPYYIAPEVLFEKYDEKCDIWSCGIILYIILCGYPPFNGENDSEILAKIKLGKFTFPDEEWEHVSDSAKNLILKMLTFKPEERPSAGQCLEHPWIKDHNKRVINPNLGKKCLNNMRKFHAGRKLQQAALTYIVNYLLTKEEKNEMLEMFQSLDTNGDGVLSSEEIYEGYRQTLGDVEARKEVDRIMTEIDIDKNGTIDYNEFVMAATNRQKILNKEKLEATFKVFDKDGSGSISAEEIKSVLCARSDNKKYIDDLIKEADQNGDGEISLSEFKEMMKKLVG